MTIELLGQRIFFLIWLILFIPSIEAHNFSCLPRCGSRSPVNYPFGFSEGCKIKLNCNEEGDIKIGEFQVRNITEENILINIPTNCSRPIETIRALFNSNHFFPTSQNSLLLQECNSSLGGCLIQPSLLEKRFSLLSCNSSSKNENISCYSSDQNYSTFLGFESLIRTGCRFLFSSVVVDEAAVTLDLQTLQLGWWLSGQCGDQCHPNANCTDFQTSNGSFGFRCQCKEGFQGDGFIDGHGCQKISGCNASKYVPGQCEETVGIGLLIGGIIAGASAMAGLAAICYFIRKRSRSLKSRSSNASIPFYPYKEIERATDSFSEKHRLGTGAYGTIVDPFLEPHRDAWTFSSVHKVAELAFRCLAFHKDMRPSMREVADELEHIRLSGWAPLDENICIASSVGSVCSSPYSESEKSFGGVSAKKASIGSRRVIVPKWVTDSLSQMEDVKENSPVSVQDPWLSEQSSPSTNSLL
ncbi:hypothetical protein RJ641_011769, partial [Dillenia turbinata]